MAGDWIKLELATPTKPEVAMLAELWQRDRDAALGACVRFWCWCSNNFTGSTLDHVTESTLDATMFKGFTAGMLQVEWLERKGDQLRIPRYDNHLAGSAKARAAAQRRQQKRRSGESVASRNGHADVTPLSRSRHGPSATPEADRQAEQERERENSVLPALRAQSRAEVALPALPEPRPGETVAELLDALGVTDPTRGSLVASTCTPAAVRAAFADALDSKRAGRIRRVVPTMLGTLRGQLGIELSPRKTLQERMNRLRRDRGIEL